MSTPAAVGKGRFQRIQEVLREAAGDSPSDYGGLGPLWELPLEQLLTAALYGVRLIAPASATTASCCSHTSAGTGETRADRSGRTFPDAYRAYASVAPRPNPGYGVRYSS